MRTVGAVLTRVFLLFRKRTRVFSFSQILKKCYGLYHIEYLRPVYEPLNVDKKKLITQFCGKLRDERFEPN